MSPLKSIVVVSLLKSYVAPFMISNWGIMFLALTNTEDTKPRFANPLNVFPIE